MTALKALATGIMGVLWLCADAPATDPPPITALACTLGSTWTYQFTATSAFGKGLNGSETFTSTACGDRRVLHPTGKLVRFDLVSDANGDLLSGFSVFDGSSERYTKPFPVLQLPLAPQAAWSAPVDIDLGAGDGLTGSGHWSTGGWETITVAAGTYRCLRRQLKMDFDASVAGGTVNGAFRQTSWYCPDVGTDAKAVASDSFGDSATVELAAVALK